MNHLEFAALESAMLDPTDWDRWIDRLEKLVGHELDGNHATDGYSLDHCGEMFDQGKTPAEALGIIRQERREPHKFS